MIVIIGFSAQQHTVYQPLFDSETENFTQIISLPVAHAGIKLLF